MEIKTPRLCLRAIKIRDAHTLYKWGQDPIFEARARFEHYTTLASAILGAKAYAKRPYSYGLELRTTHQLIGLVELYERGLDENAGLLMTKEVGFLLDRGYWHQGLMTEALTAVFDQAFNQMKQHEIWAGTFSENQPAQSLLKKLGFQYVYEVDYSRLSARFDFVVQYFRLTAAQWQLEKNHKK